MFVVITAISTLSRLMAVSILGRDVYGIHRQPITPLSPPSAMQEGSHVVRYVSVRHFLLFFWLWLVRGARCQCRVFLMQSVVHGLLGIEFHV